MRSNRTIAKALLAGALSTALGLGVMTLTAPRAEALDKIPLCGPTILWRCTGPAGQEILFPATICLKTRFEKRSGYRCVPYTG